MQDANHVHTVGSLDIEEQMAADAVATVAFTNLVASTSTMRVSSDPLDRCPHLGYVDLRLSRIPALLSEVPDC